MPPARFTTRLAGGGHAPECAWPRLVHAHAALIPAYPGPAVVPAVTVPAPPLAPPGAPPEALASALGCAYAGAVARRYRTRYGAGAFARRVVARHPAYLALAECALALVEHAVPAAAWCAFSVDVWRESIAVHTPRPRAVTPLLWVCSASRVDEKLDWYRALAPRYGGGRLCLGDDHRNLLRVWSRMQHDLLGLRDASAEDVRAVVGRHFPPGAYAQQVARAKADALAAQAQLRAAVERGVFLW